MLNRDSDLLLLIKERIFVSILMRHFLYSSSRRHTRFDCDWSSDVCSSDLHQFVVAQLSQHLHQVLCFFTMGRSVRIIRLNIFSGAAVMAGGYRRIREQTKTTLKKATRSEERRVGKECRSRGSPYHLKKKTD